MHPSTTVEDIVNDLIESEIKIEAKDVLKKSKPEAALCSYKISVPSADLTKALDPSIWPMRVKVREFIHYSNKPKKSDDRKNVASEVNEPRQGNQQATSFDQDVISVPVPNLGNVVPPATQ